MTDGYIIKHNRRAGRMDFWCCVVESKVVGMTLDFLGIGDAWKVK
jgi:hypothetical protein